ncbi:MAG: hypothetical protein ACFB15_20450 [Cyclobacteriaceae bacterium]
MAKSTKTTKATAAKTSTAAKSQTTTKAAAKSPAKATAKATSKAKAAPKAKVATKATASKAAPKAAAKKATPKTNGKATSKAPIMAPADKLAKTCQEAATKFEKMKDDKYTDIKEKLEWCLGSYGYDKNPSGLKEYGEKAVGLLKAAKQDKPRLVSQKLIDDLEKSITKV